MSGSHFPASERGVIAEMVESRASKGYTSIRGLIGLAARDAKDGAKATEAVRPVAGDG
jgi:hypothetical protein